MSRRAAENLIAEGRVTVDGRRVKLGDKADPTTARIEVDGIPLPVRPGLVYYLLYKPTDVVSTVADPQRRPTVVDLVPRGSRVHPVGRLDADSEGLIVLTNDGDLTYQITHPRFGVTKTYVVRVDGNVGPKTARLLTAGIELDDGPARAVSARVIARSAGESLIEIVMQEGRKREVRRMLEAVGHRVIGLTRTAIGPIKDPRLVPGTFRELTLQEVRALYAAASTPWDDPGDD